VPVCVTDEVAEPGSFVVVDVADRSLIVCRNRSGELRAHHNVCRHRGTQLLSEGERGRVERFFQCPYHAWAYDLDGACLGTPLFTPESGISREQQGAFDMSDVRSFDKADHGLYPARVDSWAYDLDGTCVGTPLFTGSDIPPDQQAVFDMDDVKEFDRADYGLLKISVDSWGPLVFVNRDPDPAPLSEDLGDLPARTAGHRLEEWEIARVALYELAANYKLVGENFMEYYHLPWVHPGLVQVSPIEAPHRWQGPGMYSGFCTTPIAQDTEEGGWGSGLPPISGLNESDAVSARFIWLFPNVAVNILPNHLFIILARATSPRSTHETTYLLTHPESTADGDSEQAVEQLASFWDSVNREDIEIVERVQKGLDTTPFPGGRLCYRFEESLHRFQNMVIDRMVGERRVPPGDDVEAAPMFSRSVGDPSGAPGR
jgi:choline monooxygenase